MRRESDKLRASVAANLASIKNGIDLAITGDQRTELREYSELGFLQSPPTATNHTTTPMYTHSWNRFELNPPPLREKVTSKIIY